MGVQIARTRPRKTLATWVATGFETRDGAGNPRGFDSSVFRQPPLAQPGQSCSLLRRRSHVRIVHGGR
jgi:hypothetical protein